jgi:hypothetical protein
MERTSANEFTYNIPHLDTSEYNQLALIITRIDPGERTDPAGNYHLALDSSSNIVVDDDHRSAESLRPRSAQSARPDGDSKIRISNRPWSAQSAVLAAARNDPLILPIRCALHCQPSSVNPTDPGRPHSLFLAAPEKIRCS